ncbi:MFS transporter [Crocinitomicaceae bacterium]|jgi:MFS family permease|nr:MFS transporter [Flavobacteriales bacterium]MDC0272535.1 MFS transporter [Crocinitomicaceae bacterium]
MNYKYGKNFWLLSLSMFFFMTSFNLILPELNSFITELGGADKKGLIITLFTISAAISRPFSGKLTDTIGRKKVIYFGIFFSMLISWIYPFSFSVFFFLILRFLHGFSAGFTPTGTTALLTDLIPASKRGQAMGIWGTFISLGFGVGQFSGSWIGINFGMDALFLIAGFTSVISGLFLLRVEETLEKPEKFDGSQLKVNWKDVIEPSVVPAAVVMMLTASCSGIIFVLAPDISGFLGIENKGFFFGYYVMSTIFVRLFSSSLSDRIGRRETMLIGVCILLVSMILLSRVDSYNSFVLAAIVFGLATGVSSPTLFAWTADLSHIKRRGVGAGTIFIALEAGIMLGSTSTIFTYNSTPQSIQQVFLFGILMSILAILYLLWHKAYRTSDF